MSYGRHRDNSSPQHHVNLERSSASPSHVDDDVDHIGPVDEDATRDTQTSPTAARHGSVKTSLSADKQEQDSNGVDNIPLLRYRRTALWLLLCYVPFLILPWILVNIMVDRPPNLPSYYNQRGEYGYWTVLGMVFWLVFVRVLNSIASVLVVPITSALLAQGAVVYTQRRKAEQKLNLAQTFALSDRGWADIPILWGVYRERGNGGNGSKYLMLAACLLALSKQAVPGLRLNVRD